jgi:uncharacterized protein (TIGR00369 family)
MSRAASRLHDDPAPGSFTRMAENKLTFDQIAALLQRGPFHRWLGLRLVKLDEAGIEIAATWREEFVVNPDRGYTHGGILAALVDVAGDYAVAAKHGRPVPTIDMRVDYHKVAMPGDLAATARVIRLGSTFTTAEASVHDKDGALVASGRGVYFTAPPPAPRT